MRASVPSNWRVTFWCVRMVKRPFTKPATTHAQQIELLRARGLQIEDQHQAEHWLAHINYYRLSAYWQPFEADRLTHRFIPGTRLQQVMDVYVFDRELRLLLLDAIERLEVSMRTRWAYHLAHDHGPHAHLRADLSRKSGYFQSNLEQLHKEIQRSEEPFIRHFAQTYLEAIPPTWVSCEVMSLGLLSRWYGNLKPGVTRRNIARSYGIDEAVLESWLHHLTYLRNLCAHHSRVWNREFTILPMLTRSKPENLRGQWQQGHRKIYNTLLILQHLMSVVAPGSHWRARLKALIHASGINSSTMGFPQDWTTRPVWNEDITP